jgi:hypothetical protein
MVHMIREKQHLFLLTNLRLFILENIPTGGNKNG